MKIVWLILMVLAYILMTNPQPFINPVLPF